MWALLKKWLGQAVNPIGIDFGSDSLRLAQVQVIGGEPRLIAAARADVPDAARTDPAARATFLVHALRDLVAQGKFQGRRAMLGLPAASMFIQHIRLPKMDDEATKKALPWEARGKLPIDPSQALLRHLVAGEIYQEQEPKNEIILMAASRELVNQLLSAAAKARLDVVGMNVEPSAIIDCFSHVYRRKGDGEMTNLFVDLGCAGSRAFISRAGHILFARAMAIGSEHLSRAIASQMKISLEEARLLRLRLAELQPALNENEQKQEVLAPEVSLEQAMPALAAAMRSAEGGVATATAVMQAPTASSAGRKDKAVDPRQQLADAEAACREPVGRLIEELDLCRRYYESTFPNKPVERIVFVGGEARNRSLCQHIARELGVAAQVGDPLIRMGRISDVSIESGIDRRQPQPAWATAIGLSLGPRSAVPAARVETPVEGAGRGEQP